MPAYLTLDEAKAWLNITGSVADADVTIAIAEASGLVARHLGFDPARDTRTETLYGNGTKYLCPRHTPITAVTSAAIAGIPVTMAFDPEMVWRTDGLAIPHGEGVDLTYTAGLVVLPDDLVLATKITMQAVFTAPALNPNMTSENSPAFSGGQRPGGAGALPDAARSILQIPRRKF
jgi:hypothetical protein